MTNGIVAEVTRYVVEHEWTHVDVVRDAAAATQDPEVNQNRDAQLFRRFPGWIAGRVVYRPVEGRGDQLVTLQALLPHRPA